MNKMCILACAFWAMIPMHTACGESRSADVVCKKWNEWQHIFNASKSLEDMSNYVYDDSYIFNFKHRYQSSIVLLRSTLPLLTTLTDGAITSSGFQLSAPIKNSFADNMKTLFSWLDHDMNYFFDFCIKELADSSVQYSGARGFVDQEIKKYTTLMELFFSCESSQDQDVFLFALANRFFEYAFVDEPSNKLQSLLLHQKYHPIARLLYTVIWYYLAGTGWKNWAAESLDYLQKRSAQGNKIIYIAGGSDIMQLLKSGIYTIKNIDPQLPSQPKYYADQWAWFIKGDGENNGIGDVMTFVNHASQQMSLKRISYHEDGTSFQAKLANGQNITIPHSVTVWEVLDQDGVCVGSYTLDRRFVQQSDFTEKNATYLLSFNELYYISLPNMLDGWGIEPSYFPEDIEIVIKQLRRPINKYVVGNIRIASLLNNTDFKFINLGTCIN